uniref:tripartite tricarboxylate transporter permease n=1 Tax=Pararhizobium sp. IMCC3301 TaxID=3067904 RepID=UPI002741E304|nr:tripartite tricarboxylate transporter permease [Pararhizobium sp. IMCC3301]
MDFLLQGIPEVASIQVFLMLSLGLVVGIVIGSIPGLNVPLAVAIALPITFNVEPIAGLAMLVGIYKGGTYGGSLTAVLINVPGTPAAAATAIDGNELTRQGKAGKALKMSLYASVIAEFVSDIALIAFAVPMAVFALRIGPPESFSLGIFALTLVGVLSQGNMVKGLIAAAMGLFLSTFGVDPLSGEFRLTFGFRQLSGGWSFIALVIGVFAIAEALSILETSLARRERKGALKLSDPDHCLDRDDWRRSLPVIGRSSLIGVFIGAVPGLGSAVSAYLNYGLSRSLSREPERFGKGAIEGVAAAEAGNNAVTSSTFVPLLTLGIPGDVITAIMLGAFIAHGLIPGPALFEQQGPFVAGFFLMIVAASALHLVIGRLGMYAFIQTARVSNPVLFPAVLVLGVTGIFVSTSSYFDVYVMVGFGVMGYLMNRLGFPIAPLLIGFILGPLIEVGLRQAAIMGRGDLTIFLTRPISAMFLACAVLTIVVVGWREYADRRKRMERQKEEPLT